MSPLTDSGVGTGRWKLLTLLAALAVVFDGFDIQILAFAIPSLMREWHLPRADFGPVLALGLAGMAVGGPLAGYAGDRFGRRPALIASVLLFGLATMSTGLVEGLAGLSFLRFVTGLGVGGAVPNAAALAAEFAPLRRRATAVKLTIVCVPLGGMLGGFVAARVLPALGWRALYAVGGGAPLLFVLVLLLALPESPRFLAGLSAGGERLSLFTAIRALFRPGLALDTAGLWIAFFSCLGSIYLVFGWLPSLLSAQGMGVGTASSGLALYNFGGVLGVLFLTALLTVLGSRGPMLIASFATAASAAALLFVPPADVNWLIAGIALNGFLANAVQTALYALAAHVYPTRVRSSGVACASAVGRVGGLFSSLAGASVIERGPSAYWWCLAIAMLFAFAGLASVRHHIPAAAESRPD